MTFYVHSGLFTGIADFEPRTPGIPAAHTPKSGTRSRIPELRTFFGLSASLFAVLNWLVYLFILPHALKYHVGEYVPTCSLMDARQDVRDNKATCDPGCPAK